MRNGGNRSADGRGRVVLRVVKAVVVQGQARGGLVRVSSSRASGGAPIHLRGASSWRGRRQRAAGRVLVGGAGQLWLGR